MADGIIQTVLPADRVTVLTRLLLALAILVVASVWYFGLTSNALLFSLTVLATLARYTFYPLVRLLFSGQAIIVTDKGLVDRTGALDFVRWGEVRAARIRSYKGLKLLQLDLNDQEAVLARLPAVRRVLLRHSIRSGGIGPCLNASFVQGGVAAVMRVIEEHRSDGRGGQDV